jgi:hypothetical protein
MKVRYHVGCPLKPNFAGLQDNDYPFSNGLIRFNQSNTIPQNYWWETWNGNKVLDHQKTYDLMVYDCKRGWGIYHWAWMLKKHGVSPGPFASGYVSHLKRQVQPEDQGLVLALSSWEAHSLPKY